MSDSPLAFAPPVPLDDDEFKARLVAMIPQLRAFARSLDGWSNSEDLAQETMIKAWRARASFQPGTNFKSWCFTILRNQFLSEKRRSWRNQPLEAEMAENTLVANDDPDAREDLLDVRNAMMRLPQDQREALILMCAAGLSHEETAQICGCAVGTVKSRVNRARASLKFMLEKRATTHRAPTDISSIDVFEHLLEAGRQLSKPRQRKPLAA